MSNRPEVVERLFCATDAALITAVFLAAWSSASVFNQRHWTSMAPSLAFCLGFLCVLALAGLYTKWPLDWKRISLRTLTLQAALFMVLYVHTNEEAARSELAILRIGALFFPISLATQWLVGKLWESHKRHPYNTPFVLVYGDEAVARQFIATSRRDREARFCRFIGCVGTNGKHSGSVEGIPIVAHASNLRDYLFHNAVDTLIYASVPETDQIVIDSMQPALELGVRVGLLGSSAADFNDRCAELELDVQREVFLGNPVDFVYPLPQREAYRAAKRLTDIIISAVALVPLLPLFAIIALIIKITSPSGPVFYPWRVLGKNGKPFTGYKFRTMVPNADDLKKQLMHLNEMSGPVFKMKSDPRVTAVGRFLRKYSLDELPQLYSVLKGDMSLVGPRPPSKAEAENFEFWQRSKLNVKPGITCLWQVNGRNHISSFDDWARLDLEYIRTASWWTDMNILLRTIPVVLRGHGAC